MVSTFLFLILIEKTYVVDTQWKRLIETLPMSITTIIFEKKYGRDNDFSVDKRTSLGQG